MMQKFFSQLYSMFIVFMVSLVCVGTWVSCSVKDMMEDEPVMNPTGNLKSVWPKPDDRLASQVFAGPPVPQPHRVLQQGCAGRRRDPRRDGTRGLVVGVPVPAPRCGEHGGGPHCC